MWDNSTPTTLSTSSTNQLKVSLGVRATTLCSIEILAKSSRWTSPNTGMIAVRGKRSDAQLCQRVPTKLWLDCNTTENEKGRGLPEEYSDYPTSYL